ncbi:MAG: hypothetical protein D6820_11370, partial [Lentisphaerae bacterium]
MNQQQIPDRVGTFRKTREQFIKEMDALAVFYEHEPTQAPVLIFHNDDDHKVFCTYFATFPEDHTGVPHILEHSVLNGSRKYPVKEPFLELIKASLYTFLNAMTYDDKTVYPVASRNPHDFRNLMDVYLDAIYHPLLTRETFMQEGWHLGVEPESKQLFYSGVVYNEMLGATSTPESLLYEEIQKNLLPDTPYHFSSGGDPEHIPALTYENYLEFYRRHYHPSNSRTVIYGDVNIQAVLEHLAEYYDEYTYREPTSVPNLVQPSFEAPRQVETTYPATPTDVEKNAAYCVHAWLLPEPKSGLDYLTYAVLEELLIGNHAAPLYRVLNESGLGTAPIVYLYDEICTPYLIAGLKGVNADQTDEVGKLIRNCLHELVEKRLDPRHLEAAINAVEFRLREANFGGYSKGLVYALNSA